MIRFAITESMTDEFRVAYGAINMRVNAGEEVHIEYRPFVMRGAQSVLRPIFMRQEYAIFIDATKTTDQLFEVDEAFLEFLKEFYPEVFL